MEKILNLYSQLSKSYNLLYGEEQKKKYELILHLEKPHGIIADLGCGTGMFLDYLIPLCEFIVGLDLCAEMIEVAKNRRGDNVDLVVGDIHLLPFRSSVFNYVYSISVLGNTIDHKVLRPISDVLKPHGVLVLTLIRGERLDSILYSIIGRLKRLGFGRTTLMDVPEIKDIIIFSKHIKKSTVEK